MRVHEADVFSAICRATQWKELVVLLVGYLAPTDTLKIFSL